MSEIILSTHGLTKAYNGKNVVDNVSLSVKRGDIYGFVGLNGAGKTTLMRMVSGLIQPTMGWFLLFGKKGAEADAARSKTAAIIEGPIFYPSMTGLENVKQYLSLLNKDTRTASNYLKQVRLDPGSKKKAKSYSLGMKQRLAIAMALASDAELLLLDEPTNGLDPEGMYEIRELLKYLNQQKGVTIFISSHILSELGKLATTYGFIHYGKLIKEVSALEIENSVFKCRVLETSDNQKAQELFKDDSEIVKDKLEIRGDLSINEIVKRLDSASITAHSINTRQTDLEDYFRKLIGGIGV